MRESLQKSSKFLQIFGLQYFQIDSMSGNAIFASGTTAGFKTVFGFYVLLLATMLIILIRKIVVDAAENLQVENNLRYVRVLLLVLLEISITHAFISTSKAKVVFEKLIKVENIFKNQLNFELKSEKFSEKFIRIFFVTTTIFTIWSASLLFSIYHFESLTYALISLFYVVFLYFYAEMFYMRFVFFILLVRHNLRSMKKVLERLETSSNVVGRDEISFLHLKPFVLKQNEIFYSLLSLKEIYGILYEVTETINSLCGISIVIQLFMTVLTNVSAGLKIFLAANQAMPLNKLGSKLKYPRNLSLIVEKNFSANLHDYFDLRNFGLFGLLLQFSLF